MSASMHNAQILIDKIQALPVDRIAEVEDFVEFLRQRSKPQQSTSNPSLNFPIDELGAWPEGLNLSREEMYGDYGR